MDVSVKDCPKCKLPIAGDENLQSLFQFPFLVIAISFPTATYSAYDMHIVFKERPTQEFEVGIDYAEKQTSVLDEVIFPQSRFLLKGAQLKLGL